MGLLSRGLVRFGALRGFVAMSEIVPAGADSHFVNRLRDDFPTPVVG
jgi:hypothetical protein